MIALYESETTRVGRAVEAATVLAEVIGLYAPSMRRQSTAFSLWQRQARFLLSLLSSGPLA
jgi:hypothetical protein